MGYSFIAVIFMMIAFNVRYAVTKIIGEYRKDKALIAKRAIVQENLESFLKHDEIKKRVMLERRGIKRDLPNSQGNVPSI